MQVLPQRAFNYMIEENTNGRLWPELLALSAVNITD